MEVTVTDTTIVASDRVNHAVEIATVGWDQSAPKLQFPFAMDATISGRATRLSTDANSIAVGTIDEDGTPVDRHPLNPNTELDVSGDEAGEGTYVAITAPINTWIRFGGDAVVEKRGEEHVIISFPQPTPVTLGFMTDTDVPSHGITVPRTPEGVATGLSYLPASFTESSPRRGSPTFRSHPPRIEFGDETSIPEELRTAATLGVELVLPPTLDALIPAASLSAYVGADVRVSDGATPTLRVPSVGLAHELAPPPSFQHEASALLRRVFFLDMLVRWTTASEFDWFEADALTVLDLDPGECVDRPMGERVATYLSVDFERVSPIFPELASYVYAEPAYRTVRSLPYLAANLTQPYLPDARPDRPDAPAERPDVRGTPGGTAGTDRRTGPHPRTRGPYVGCLDGEPMDGAYEPVHDAYVNRGRYFGDDETASVALVGGGPERAGELDRIREFYRGESVTLSVVEEPTRDRLADLIAEGVDLLHYVGPCRDGLECADGSLDPADVEESSVRTFFLDGPDSRATGHDLLPAGSVAGAVWNGEFGPGTDAARRNFVRLLVAGLTFDLAKRYALEYADGTASLSVLGDGLHELVEFDQLQVYPMEVEPLGDRQFRVQIPPLQTDVGIAFGGLCLERWQFGGNEFDLTLDAADLTQLLETQQYAVIYEGEVYDPADLTPFDPTV